MIGRRRIDDELEFTDEVLRRHDRQILNRPAADIDAGIASRRREAVRRRRKV